MQSPGLYDYFAKEYNQYSLRSTKFIVPEYVDFYEPDNKDEEFYCVGVLVPNPLYGAKKFTHEGKIISIGVYRDQGRPITEYQLETNIFWFRIGTRLILQHQNNKHEYVVDEEIKIYNVNVSTLTTKIVNVIDDYHYEVVTEDNGDIDGYFGASKPTRLKNFSEENIVFRLLPSFKLITILEMKLLLGITETSYNKPLDIKSILNITTNKELEAPVNQNKNVNYYIDPLKPTYFNKQSGYYHDQVFDESGNPLRIEYYADGKPVESDNIDGRYKNNKIFVNQSLTQEIWADPTQGYDSIVYVYDFYGFLINDVDRSPFNNDLLVVKNNNINGIENNIALQISDTGLPKYNGKYLLDNFGNKVVGVSEQNTTVIKKFVLPLALDKFNKPIKQPVARG